MQKQTLDALQTVLQKTVDHFEIELGHIRTSGANVNLLSPVKVESYGALLPLQDVASVSLQDARTLLIKPYEKSAIAAIKKGIILADLGLNPVDDGQVIRVPVPMLTEEKRKELVKKAKKILEDAKIGIRKNRQDANDAIKKAKKEGACSEDDAKKIEQEIEKIVKKYTDQMEAIFGKKEKDLLTI